MQALDTLAEEGEVSEETMKEVALESQEGDMLYAVASEVAEEVYRAQKDQDLPQDELEFTCEGMVTASKEFTTCWVQHNAACADVNNTSAKLSCAQEKTLPPRALQEKLTTNTQDQKQL